MSLECQLVQLESGKMAMQVRLGQFSATHELPDNLATCDHEALRDYFASVVPQMVVGLREMKRDYERKLNKKAKKHAEVGSQSGGEGEGEES